MALRIFGKKFNRMQTIAFFSAGAILWAILIIVIGVLNIREGDRRQTRSVTGIVNPESYPANFTGVAIIAKISNIDIPNFRYLVHFELFPIGNGLADPKDPLGRTPLVPLSITFDTQIRRFPASQAMSAQDLLFTITDGDTNMYPFDQFANQMNIFANIANNVSRSAAADTTPDGPAFTTSQPLPVAVSLGGALQAWSFTLGVNDTTTNIQTITTVFDRSFTVRFFSMFIIIVMWGLSLCTLALSSSVLVKSKEVPPQILVSWSSLRIMLEL